MASIGNYRAVADTMGVRMSGVFAWLMWRAFYLGMLPGMVTKLRVVIDWVFDLFAPRNLGQIEQERKSSAKMMRFSKGQTSMQRPLFPESISIKEKKLFMLLMVSLNWN